MNTTAAADDDDINHIAHAPNYHEESNTATQYLIATFRQYDKDKSGT